MRYKIFELYCHIAITYVIKAIKKLSNVIGYHWPDLSTNGTVLVISES